MTAMELSREVLPVGASCGKREMKGKIGKVRTAQIPVSLLQRLPVNKMFVGLLQRALLDYCTHQQF